MTRRWSCYPTLWLLLAALLVLSVAYGLSYSLAPALRVPVFHWASAAFFLLLLGAALALFARGREPIGVAWRSAWYIPAATGAMLLATAFLSLPNRIVIVVAAVLVGLAIALRSESRQGLLADLYLGVGWLLCIYLVFTVPIDPARADMLPFIARAGQEYLVGHNPYVSDYSVIDSNSFLYLPIQWLAYLPLVAVGWDLRIVNLAAMLLLMVLLRSALRRSSGRSADQAALLLYPALLSYPAVQAVVVGQAWVYWVLVGTLGLGIMRGRLAAAAVLLGLALATRQTALIIAGAFAVYFFGQLSVGRLLLLGALAAGVWLATFAPFADGDLGGLLRLVYLERPAFQAAKAVADGNPGDQISLVGYLDPNLAAPLGRYAQLVLAVVFAVIIWRLRRRGPGVLLVLTGAFYLFAMGLNGYVHRYYYIAGFLLIGIGLSGLCANGSDVVLSGKQGVVREPGNGP